MGRLVSPVLGACEIREQGALWGQHVCLHDSLPSKCLTRREPPLRGVPTVWGAPWQAGLARGSRTAWTRRPEASQAAFSRCEFLLQTKGRDFVCRIQESRYHPPGSWVSPAPLRAVAGRRVRAPPHPCPCVYSGHRCPLAPFRTNWKNPKTQPPPPLQVRRDAWPVLYFPGTCSPHCGLGHGVSHAGGQGQ